MNQKVKVKLDNIGIVQHSEIDLHGLTIITGHNNSGKTTVGKTLYSILSAVENLEDEANKDKCSFATSELQRIRSKYKRNQLYFPFFLDDGEKKKYELEANEYLDYFFNKNPDLQFDSVQNVVRYTEVLKKAVEKTTGKELEKILSISQESSMSKRESGVRIKKQIIAALDKMLDSLVYDPELVYYANRKINKSLKQEFNNQVIPVKRSDATGKVELWCNKQCCFDFSIERNEIEAEKKVYYGKSYYDVTFVNDVFVVDKMFVPTKDIMKGIRYPNNFFLFGSSDSSWDELSSCKTHQEDLLEKLTQKNSNLFEEMIHQKNANELFVKINEVFPDEILLDEGGYICSDSKLDVKNLAAGSKMFAIVKKLIESAIVREDTLLILDEPESHLHPEWQNKFAEIIVLLVKYLQPHILLTTHSPNFLMALEIYAKKIGIWDNFTNVYCTEHVDDYMVQYVDVKDSMKHAYGKLADPLFKLKQIELP